MGLFAGLRRLDRGVRSGWKSSTRAAGLNPGTMLTWERTVDDRYCIASAGLLSISSAGENDLVWQHIGWHRIERGGYDTDTSTLRWQLYDTGQGSESGNVRLKDPGRLPQLFRDRVAASIAVEQFVALEGARRVNDVGPGVIISGRRDLARPDAPIEWQVSLPRGLDWSIPGLRELAETAINQVRDEYDPRA